MTATASKVFVPNMVLIPEAAIPHENNHGPIDPADCTLLYLDGDRNSGDVYTKDAWENDGKPSYKLHDDAFFKVRENGVEEPFCRAALNIYDQDGLKGDRIHLLPDMCVVKVDETANWEEKGRKKLGIKRIFGVYVFNRRKSVYCCEITPSYERVFFGSQWDAELPEDEDAYEKARDAIDEFICEGDMHTDDFSYVHCSSMDKAMETELQKNMGALPPEGKWAGGYTYDTGMMTEEDAIESIREGQRNGEL